MYSTLAVQLQKDVHLVVLLHTRHDRKPLQEHSNRPFKPKRSIAMVRGKACAVKQAILRQARFFPGFRTIWLDCGQATSPPSLDLTLKSSRWSCGSTSTGSRTTNVNQSMDEGYLTLWWYQHARELVRIPRSILRIHGGTTNEPHLLPKKVPVCLRIPRMWHARVIILCPSPELQEYTSKTDRGSPEHLSPLRSTARAAHSSEENGRTLGTDVLHAD